MPLAEANLVNTLDFIYIEHDIYCNCIHHKNFKLHKCKEEGNHAPAPLVLWPPSAEDTIRVVPPESQGSLWSWSLQAECYKESIFIHCTYVTFYACSFPHHNIHTHIMYIFKVSISMCKCPQDLILIYIYIYIYILFIWKSNYYCLKPQLLLFDLLLSWTSTIIVWFVIVLNLNCYCLRLDLLLFDLLLS